MIPTQQGFKAGYAPGFQIEDRLIMQLKLLCSQSQTQVGRHRMAFLNGKAQGMLIKAESPPSICLGRIKRKVDISHQHIRIVTVHRSLCNADATGHKFRDVTKIERLLECRKEAICEHGDLFNRIAVINDGEFIATKPRDELITDDVLKTNCDLLEKQITNLMTSAVIDVLEMINVEIKQRECRRTLSLFQHPGNVLREIGTVW